LALDRAQKRDSGARALIITGMGNEFCSGLDLHSMNMKDTASGKREHCAMRAFMDPLILRLSGFRLPIIAAVNGAAVGAGMSLALASDIIIAGENAYFNASFARIGLVPDAGITFHLARRIGAGRSVSSLLLADTIDAATAHSWGLAYAVVPPSEVLPRARAVADQLAAGPCFVLGQIRMLHASAYENSLRQQLRAERNSQAFALETSDVVEGVRAFFERRKPNFTDS
jgi:2-(1,2-epoxy-1,2-dihydrophenyl)acetyl-CoA isomerase